ncbi:MAG: hypothetical protein GY796_11620 [Chloroflexi bacterium]|nr:hypothetical protein [Chloroflexota bacterium]
MEDLIGLIIGLTLTLFIYSYLFIGDKFPYRLAIHILVGASAAYAAVIIMRQLFLPWYETIAQNSTPTTVIYWLVPILLTLFLLLRRLPTASWLGNNTLAFLVGVGAAIALVGALTGTLWPQISGGQVNGTTNTAVRTILVAVLTGVTLLTFQFTTFRASSDGVWAQSILQKGIAASGRVVLMITFGALFAMVLNTSFILLANRINFFVNEMSTLLAP